MEEEDEVFLNYPYYEMTYLDDNNIKHLAQVQSEDSVNYLKERFRVETCDFINA